MTRCPVHEGDGHSATFWVDRDGNVAFHCHAYQCDFKAMMVTLDLPPGDFLVNPYPKRERETSQDRAFCVVAENDLRAGRKLSPSEMERYQVALLNTRGAA